MKALSGKSENEIQKRQTLLDEGRLMCYSEGLLSLRLDSVATAAGISKRTLYNYYGTRTSFIAAVIDFDGVSWREWFFDAIREQADRPEARLRAFFTTLAHWSQSRGFQGCLFARAFYLHETPPTEIATVVHGHIGHIRAFLRNNARKAGVEQGDTVASCLLLPALTVLSGVGHRVDNRPGLRLAELADALLSAQKIQWDSRS